MNKKSTGSASTSSEQLTTLGWCEVVSLPDLGIDRIKVKVDTGAKTSCLHCFDVQEFDLDGSRWLRFGVHPKQDNNEIEIWCEAPITDQRTVTDSGGHSEQRYVVTTNVTLAGKTWPIEMTLTNRDSMKFRMLLGRTGMAGRFQVDPSRTYCLGE